MSENKIVRPRLSQAELFIITELLQETQKRFTPNGAKTPYSLQVRKLYRKLRRNLKVMRVSYQAASKRVVYVKTEQPKETAPINVEPTEQTQTAKPFNAWNY